jgi:hypothetical protein
MVAIQVCVLFWVKSGLLQALNDLKNGVQCTRNNNFCLVIELKQRLSRC